jgi:hypothetical protein
VRKNTITQDQTNNLVFNYLSNLKLVTTKKRIILKNLAPKYKTIRALTYLRKTHKLALIIYGAGLKRRVYWGVI